MQDPKVNVTGDLIPKRPGRPAKNGVAMTAAQRQRAYRDRVRKGSGSVAIVNPRLASRPELMRQLNACLFELDANFDASSERWAAGKIIDELVMRYDLKL